MSGSLLVWTLLALAVFWCVGLYNRLMRMRARGFDAFGSVEKYLRQYRALVDAHLSQSGSSLHLGGGDNFADSPLREWEPLVKILHGLDLALKEARSAPLQIAALTRLADVFAEVQATWKYLCDLPADLAGPLVPDALRWQWDATTAKVQTARGGFNQILSKYNEAIGQFPARLVVGMMRFERSGLL
jgi:LemA protein